MVIIFNNLNCQLFLIMQLIFMFTETNYSHGQIPYNNSFPNHIFIYSPLPNWTGAGGACGGGATKISISNAGDVNKDGYDDIIIGNCLGGGNYRGNTFAYFGSSNGLSTVPNWVVTGEDYSNLGSSVSSAEDVNRDGYADVLVGGFDFVNLYYGRSTGISTAANWVVYSENNGGTNMFGYGMSCAGDVNGDGYSDVIISDRGYSSGSTTVGKIYVYYGHSYGLNTTAEWTITGGNYGVDLGQTVSSAGDVNGDGYSDVIIGSNYITFALLKTLVFNGGPAGLNTVPSWVDSSLSGSGTYNGLSVSSAGDVNGDGYSDVIVGHELKGIAGRGKVKMFYGSAGGLNSNAACTITGDSAGDNLGSRISSAGDINKDGYSDIILNQGQSHSKLYFGSPSGLDTINSWLLNPGCEVSGAGDVNRDSYGDIIVGNGSYTYSYYGKPEIKKLNLTFFIQGFYNNYVHSMIQDTARIYLRKALFPYNVFDSAKTVINSNGTGLLSFNHTAKNLNYYIQLKHRNSLDTWSSSAISFEDSLLSYDFSNNISNAFGNNMIQIDYSPLRFAIYSGDVNKDGTIDAGDLSLVDNSILNSVSGYTKTDITGDNYTDASGLSVLENNIELGVSVITP